MSSADALGSNDRMGQAWTWPRACFPVLVLLGFVDRAHLWSLFGSRYVGTDDSILWQGATDYARLILREPYFYGQDYNPMLEALLAAPFIALGAAHAFVLPMVTGLLGLAPYWAFGAWLQRKGLYLGAAAFAAMPLLLPVAYAMSTMIPRGFVTGIAVLALWPWAMDLREGWRRSVAAGLVLSASLFMNPNAAPLSAALGLTFLLDQRDKARTVLGLAAGALPFTLLSLAARLWYQAHPERVVHTLYDWRMVFHAEGISEGLGTMGRLFHGLGPWPLPGGPWIVIMTALLLILLLRFRERAVALGVLAAWAVILFSWGFAKVHDGECNAFYPIWRMFMALPLLLLWAVSRLSARRPEWKWSHLFLVAWSSAAFVVRTLDTKRTVEREVAATPGQVLERDIASQVDDAARIQGLCDAYHADAVICLDRWTSGDAQFPAYLHPLLAERLPPTYLPRKERRHWQQEAVGAGRGLRLLVLGGDETGWDRMRQRVGGVLAVPDGPWGTAHVIPPQDLATDSVLAPLVH